MRPLRLARRTAGGTPNALDGNTLSLHKGEPMVMTDVTAGARTRSGPVAEPPARPDPHRHAPAAFAPTLMAVT